MTTGTGRATARSRIRLRKTRLMVAIGSCLSVLSACSLFAYSPTPLPSAPPSSQPTPASTAAPVSRGATPASPPKCASS